MKTAIRHLLWITASFCCLYSQATSDTLSVAAGSMAVTTPERAHQIALAYTGFDSTARTDVVLKRFRLTTMPMTDSAGNEIIKESNLWLVTFYQLDVIKPQVYRDYKVFIDSASGLLVELYSVPDTVAPREYEVPFADESRVVDVARVHSAAPPPLSFVQALRHITSDVFAESHQVFAICEFYPFYSKTALGPPVVWSIWGSGIMLSYGYPSPENGKLGTNTFIIDGITGALVELDRGVPPPCTQWK